MVVGVLRFKPAATCTRMSPLPYHQAPDRQPSSKKFVLRTGILVVLGVLACVTLGVVASLHAVTDTQPNKPKRRWTEGPDSPTQVHISQGDADGLSVVVSWITEQADCGEVIYHAFGSPALINVTQQVLPQRYTYKYELQRGSYTSGLIHHVLVPNLSPLTTYEYKCGCESGGYSATYMFKAWGSFSNGTADQPPVSLVIIGDLGQTEYSQNTTAHAMQAGFDLSHVLIIGDMSYADSEGSPLLRNCTQKRWDSWAQMVEPLVASRQLMVLPGNHEVEWVEFMSKTQAFMAYDHRFHLPYPAQHQSSDRFYSFNVPWMHIIMLNSYDGDDFKGPYDASTRQYQWLEADLKAVDRRLFPWLIVCLHAPWYSSNLHHHNEAVEVDMRNAMEDLLHANSVDVVFAGHVHAYERTFPVFQGAVQAGGTTFINVGDGGNREGHANTWYSQPAWSAFRNGDSYGHGTLTVANSSHALWQWHRIQDTEPAVADEVWLVHNQFLAPHLVTTGVLAVDNSGRPLPQVDSPQVALE